jgi:hypothetical protein
LQHAHIVAVEQEWPTEVCGVEDEETSSDPSVTDYILETPAKCPRCFRRITDKTLVEEERWKWE